MNKIKNKLKHTIIYILHTNIIKNMIMI